MIRVSLFLILCSVSIAGPIENHDIIHSFLYPDLEGVSMVDGVIVSWPGGGPRQPTEADIESYRSDYRKWRAIENKRQDVVRATRELDALKPLGLTHRRYLAKQTQVTSLTQELDALPKNTHEPGDTVP